MPATLSLLCLPCAGASAMMYARWRHCLPSWIELVPLELPGRGRRFAEPCIDDFETLVTLLCAEQAQQFKRPYALFGHSMGALLAYGMALRLQQAGQPLPLALFASGSPAPSRRSPRRAADQYDDATLIADLRKQGGTPEEVFANAELMRITLDVLAPDYRVCDSFQQVAALPLHFPVHAFAGRQDDIGAARIEAWSATAARSFSVDWFDGGHFFIQQQQSEVLAALARRLAHRPMGRLAGAAA